MSSIVIRKENEILEGMLPTHVLNREYYGKFRMTIRLKRYPDGSVVVNAPVQLTEADILSIDWSKNTWGYVLTYPNGVQTGEWHDTPRDFQEENPFVHLLDIISE